MKNYNIDITLADGNEINAAVIAADEVNALKRVMANMEYKNFVENNQIKEIKITLIKKEEPVEKSRFYLREGFPKNWFIVTDIDSGISITFKGGDYNNTQYISQPNEKLSALQIATVLREIGDYISDNYSELL